MKKEFIEECWFIYGVRVAGLFIGFPVYHSAGTSGSVEFSWEKALNPRLIGWIHTHPKGFGPRPSETDNSTMRGWVRGVARPMICGILCNGTQGWFDYYRGSQEDTVHRREMEGHFSPALVWGKL